MLTSVTSVKSTLSVHSLCDIITSGNVWNPKSVISFLQIRMELHLFSAAWWRHRASRPFCCWLPASRLHHLWGPKNLLLHNPQLHLSSLLGTSPPKKRENVGIFPKKWFILHFRTFFGGVSHVKNSKKWKWDSGRTPPLFLQNSHIFPFFRERPLDSFLFNSARKNAFLGFRAEMLFFLGFVQKYYCPELLQHGFLVRGLF